MRYLKMNIVLFIVLFIVGCGGGTTSVPSNPSGPSTPNSYGYYYYADPTLNRVVVMSPENMFEVASILVPGLEPHSVDRAGFTNKMYVRTSGQKSFDVINSNTFSYVKTVPLNYKPRAIGAYNKYLNLQLVSGKDDPKVSIIDVNTDNVIATVGKKASGSISGNCGGNATGHSTWLDSNHFVLLDRYNDEIVIYSIFGDPYVITKTQTLKLSTGCHTMNIDIPDKSLTQTVFYAEIEGSKSKGIKPHILELFWNNGYLTPGRSVYFSGTTSEDKIHHYGINNGYIWQPVCSNNRIYKINQNTLKVEKSYPIGNGGGHVNFSPLGFVVVTNHYSNFITIIDQFDNVTNVKISEDEYDGELLQSHLNKISPDGRYFYIFASKSGLFVEVDLVNKTVNRTYYTGGTPEQSSS